MLDTATLQVVAAQGAGALEETAAEVLALRQLLLRLKGQLVCWCDTSTGHPALATHQRACLLVHEYLQQRPFTPEELTP